VLGDFAENVMRFIGIESFPQRAGDVGMGREVGVGDGFEAAVAQIVLLPGAGQQDFI
jgi:hypothetical protein